MRDDTHLRDAIARLKSTKILHRNYVSTVKHLESASWAAGPTELNVLAGPTQAGKSRAAHQAYRIPDIIEVDSSGLMETAYVVAHNTGRNGAFSTKGFVVKCLRALAHPIYGDQPGSGGWSEQIAARIARTPEPLLQMALEGALVCRQVKKLVVDEAHHVKYAPGGYATKVAIIDSWKCLAASVGVALTLIGSYELLEFLPLAPHLSSRKTVIEFPCYRADDHADVAAWLSVLNAFDELLPLAPSRSSIQSWAELLMEGSLGCVGILGRWLRQALAWCEAEEKRYLTEAALIATRPLPEALNHIAAEIELGDFSMGRIAPDSHLWLPSVRSSTTKRQSQSAPTRPFQKKARRNARDGRV